MIYPRVRSICASLAVIGFGVFPISGQAQVTVSEGEEFFVTSDLMIDEPFFVEGSFVLSSLFLVTNNDDFTLVGELYGPGVFLNKKTVFNFGEYIIDETGALQNDRLFLNDGYLENQQRFINNDDFRNVGEFESTGNFSNAAEATFTNSGQVRIEGDAFNSGTIDNSDVFDVGEGSLSNSGRFFIVGPSGDNSGRAGQTSLDENATLANTAKGTVDIRGELAVNQDAVFDNKGSADLSGTLEINAGDVTNLGDFKSRAGSEIIIRAGGVFRHESEMEMVLEGHIQNDDLGSLRLAGPSVIRADISNSGFVFDDGETRVEGSVENLGSWSSISGTNTVFTASAGDVPLPSIFDNRGVFENAGSTAVEALTTFQNRGDFQNSGLFESIGKFSNITPDQPEKNSVYGITNTGEFRTFQLNAFENRSLFRNEDTGVLTVGGVFEGEGGSLSNKGEIIVTEDGDFRLKTFFNTGSVVIAGDAFFAGGVGFVPSSDHHPATVRNFGSINLTNELSDLDIGGFFENDGTVEMSDKTFIENTGFYLNAGTTVINEGATFTNTGVLQTFRRNPDSLGPPIELFTYDDDRNSIGAAFGTFVNNGTLRNFGIIRQAEQAVITGSGEIVSGTDIEIGGTISQTRVALNDAKLSGSGVIIADVEVNDGVVAPGTSPGLLSILGDLDLSGFTTLEFELGGLMAGNLYDQIDVVGTVSLSASTLLSVTYVDSFLATEGDFFDLIVADSFSSSDLDLGSVSFPMFETDTSWALGFADVSGRTSLRLSAVSSVAAPVPLPASSLFYIVALVFLGVFYRKTRNV